MAPRRGWLIHEVLLSLLLLLAEPGCSSKVASSSFRHPARRLGTESIGAPEQAQEAKGVEEEEGGAAERAQEAKGVEEEDRGVPSIRFVRGPDGAEPAPTPTYEKGGDPEKEYKEDSEQITRAIHRALGTEASKDIEEPRKVMGVALNGKDDLRTLNMSLVIGALGGIGILYIFAVLRQMFPIVYSRQQPVSSHRLSRAKDADTPEHAHGSGAGHLERQQVDDYHWEAPVPTRFRYLNLTFLWQVWNTTAEDEVRLAGLDGWAHLEYCRMILRIITVIGPFLTAVLLPLHYYASGESSESLDVLSRLDIGNLPHENWMLWIHAGVVWLVVLVSAWQIMLAHDGFVERRYKWLGSVPRPRATTVMVRNIPPMYRSDRALREYFERVFSEGGQKDTVERAYVVRRTGRLPRLVKQLEEARYSATLAQSRWEEAESPDKESEESKELEICQQRVTSLRNVVMREQATLESSVQALRPDLSVCSSSGFVTFTSELAQRLASREQYTRDVMEFRMFMAPDPDDVIYQNLQEDEVNAASWKWIGRFALMAVFIFWVPIVVAISGWTTLSSIQGTVPMVKAWVHDHPFAEGLLSGVLATAALKLFMAFLPSVLHAIIESTLHLKSETSSQLRLQQYYALFLVLFVLLVTTLGRGLTITLVVIIQEPAKVLSLLAASLPSASHFYFNYVILGWLVLPVEMLRLANLVKFLFYAKVLSLQDDAAKQYSEPEDQASYGMGTRMALATLFSSITFTFCSCSPLVLVFTWIYFFLNLIVYGYLHIFVETKKPDTGGFFWLQAIEQLFLVLAIYVMLMAGVLHALARDGSWLGPPAVAFSALLGVYWARKQVNNLAFDTLPLEDVVKASRDKQEKNPSLVGQYIQPECDPTVAQGD